MRRLDDFLQNGGHNSFITHLPIQLDGTCNGFQHLALLSNEIKIFKELNLDDKNKNVDPSDFYSYFQDRMNIYLASKLAEVKDIKLKESYQRLIESGFTRKQVKPSLMPLPYNASIHSMAKYLVNSLVLVKKEEIKTPQNGDEILIISENESEYETTSSNPFTPGLDTDIDTKTVADIDTNIKGDIYPKYRY
jgi:DNA-directed RNA polymerase